MALRNVFIDVFRSSTKGSLTGNLSEPQSTECSSIWKTPVLSSGRVLKPTEKSLFSSPLSAHTSLAPVSSWSISTSLPSISLISRISVTVNPYSLSFTFSSFDIRISWRSDFSVAAPIIYLRALLEALEPFGSPLVRHIIFP